MYKSLRNCLLSTGIGLAALSIYATPAIGADASADATSARQEAQIWTTYALSPYLRAADIHVSVMDGKATLTGKVDEEVNKELAKQIALGVEGVRSVDNQIEVQADYAPTSQASHRRYASYVDDASISTAIRSKLAWSKHLNAGSARVETLSGKVTLTGNVETADTRDLIGRVALNTRGVVSVDNQLRVQQPQRGNTGAATQSTADAIADTWITTKVKSTFIYSSNVDSYDISVHTDNGVVTLSGNVPSGAERQLAIELAQNVRGVKRVESAGLVQ
ncbi:MAG: BON domain-containing protein [Xanthomonadales bacterium]|nr:BON domain-containing protein [Xanthomonadales bacterium]